MENIVRGNSSLIKTAKLSEEKTEYSTVAGSVLNKRGRITEEWRGGNYKITFEHSEPE